MQITRDRDGNLDVMFEKGDRIWTQPEVALALHWGGYGRVRRLWKRVVDKFRSGE